VLQFANMFDLVQLRLTAGNGGNGRVSFRREKFVPKGGPDGGNGGEGGSIYLRASKSLNTLQHFAGVKEFAAKSGQPGGQGHSEGQAGEDLVLDVPIGTRVWLLAENKPSRLRRTHHVYESQTEPVIRHKMLKLSVKGGWVEPLPTDELLPVNFTEDVAVLNAPDEDQIFRSESLKKTRLADVPKLLFAELTEEGQTVLICRGGPGGRGNNAFKGSTNTTPIQAEYGIPGEKKAVILELRLIADVGLVGYPNAGKSTLLSIVTRANPKIANYPFTTLEPNLGVMFSEEAGGKDIVLADIPGLIEGASKGKGLGYEFLRHVQACRVLLFVLSLEETLIFNSDISEKEKAQQLWDQYQVLLKELKEYDSELLSRPSLVTVSKADLYSPELLEAITKVFTKHKLEIIPISAITKKGIFLLQHALRAHLY
jgi:GTP-binding protein